MIRISEVVYETWNTGPNGINFGHTKSLDGFEVKVTGINFRRTYEYSGLIHGAPTAELNLETLLKIENEFQPDDGMPLHIVSFEELKESKEARLPLFFIVLDLQSIGTKLDYPCACLRIIKFSDDFDLTKPFGDEIAEIIGEFNWKDLAFNFYP